MRTFIVVIILNITLSCNTSTKKENTKNSIEMNKYTYTHPKEIMYGLALNMYTPFEVYVNDIPLKKWYRNSLNTFTDLNPYLLGNGKAVIKLKLLPINTRKDKLIQAKDLIEHIKIQFIRYELQREPNMGRAKNYTVLKELPLSNIEKPVPYLEQEWEVEITDLPYKLEGWRNSKDLSKMNQKELEEKVVAYYTYLRELLNEGKTEEYFEQEKQKENETKIFSYTSEEKMKYFKDISRKSILEEDKGNMWSIEHYKMFVYAHGKLVKLERVDDEFKSWSVLISEIDNGDISSTGAILHMPKGKDTFEVIRK